MKIQFEQAVPGAGHRLARGPGKGSRLPQEFFDKPPAVVEGIVEAARKEALVVLTLYSPFMLAGQTAGSPTVVRHSQEDPAGVQERHGRRSPRACWAS